VYVLYVCVVYVLQRSARQKFKASSTTRLRCQLSSPESCWLERSSPPPWGHCSIYPRHVQSVNLFAQENVQWNSTIQQQERDTKASDTGLSFFMVDKTSVISKCIFSRILLQVPNQEGGGSELEADPPPPRYNESTKEELFSCFTNTLSNQNNIASP